MTSVLNSLEGKSLLMSDSNVANMVSVQVQTDYVKECWGNLKTTAELHKAKQLQKGMSLLKDELLNLASKVESIEMTVSSREELEAKIMQIKNELNAMSKAKCKLLQANVSVHRFLSTSKHQESTLRDEVTELYQVWDQTFCRVSTQLFNLESLSQAWHDFEDHLSQLQCALRTDTLKVLDFALKSRTPSTSASVSLQDIAGLLSEKEPASKNSLLILEESMAANAGVPILTPLSTEGSLSDSGISDSGSEQDLSEREKRLAQLKRLAKRLESILAPGSQALSNMFKRIEQAETELRELQKTCRDLIVRSATSDDVNMIAAKTSLDCLDGEPKSGAAGVGVAAKPGPRKREKSRGIQQLVGEEDIEEDSAEADNKSGKRSWFWRLVRYALPLELAFVALLCVVVMMAPPPRCCDSLNNLDMSLNPQLRYDSGPPPI